MLLTSLAHCFLNSSFPFRLLIKLLFNGRQFRHNYWQIHGVEGKLWQEGTSQNVVGSNLSARQGFIGLSVKVYVYHHPAVQVAYCISEMYVQ